MTQRLEPQFYEDDPEVVATVKIDGRLIKLRTSPEFEAFAASVSNLEPKAMLQQAAWLEQMTHCVVAGVRVPSKPIHVRGQTIVPKTTREAKHFVDALLDLGDQQRMAAAHLMSAYAKRLFEIATDNDPSLIPDE